MKYLHDDRLAEWTSLLSDLNRDSSTSVGTIIGPSAGASTRPNHTTSRSLQGRVEAFSMKRTGHEKKLAMSLGERYVQWQEAADKEMSLFVASRNKQQRKKRSQSAGDLEEAIQKPVKKLARRSRASSVDSSVASSIPDTTSRKMALDLQEPGTRRLLTDLILTLNLSFPDYDFSNVGPTDFEVWSVEAACRHVNELLESSIGLPLLVDLWSAIDAIMALQDCEVYSYRGDLVFDTFSGDSDHPETESADSDTPTVLWSFNFLFVHKQAKRIVLLQCNETLRAADPVEEEDDWEVFHGVAVST